VFILEKTNKLHYIATKGKTEQASWIKILQEKCGGIKCESVIEARKRFKRDTTVDVIEKIKDMNIEDEKNIENKEQKKDEENIIENKEIIDENSEDIDIFEKKTPEPKIEGRISNLPRKTLEKKSSTENMLSTIGTVSNKDKKRKSGFGKSSVNIGVDDDMNV
jgi:hypothetical protein